MLFFLRVIIVDFDTACQKICACVCVVDVLSKKIHHIGTIENRVNFPKSPHQNIPYIHKYMQSKRFVQNTANYK